MKRLLSVFSLMVIAPMFAAAAYDSPNGKCYAENVEGAYDYVVYFENDRPSAKTDGGKDLAAVTGLSDCVNELKSKLNGISEESYIILIGSADRNASYEYNTGLAQRRINIVQSLFDDRHQNKIRTVDATKGNDVAKNGNKQRVRNPSERVVRIVIKENQQAADDYIDVIMSHAKYETDTTITLIRGDANLSRAKIDTLVKSIRSASDGVGVSVWKDKNGNFNTARLASDSIAGVVLGTAGGLITSQIIKKNQLKGGFEDIKCTIGGQVVAEYGDEFEVGRK
ncbi:hypothetical protein HDR61_03425 [bacterium]|nr:hypothetical protein [bacterium]